MPNDIQKHAGYVNKEVDLNDTSNEDIELENDKEFIKDNALAEEFTNTQISDIEEVTEVEEVVDLDEVEDQEDSDIQDNRRRSIFRSFAGVGLIYIAYSGFSDYFKGVSEDMPLYFLIFYAVFGVIGVGIFINSILTERKSRRDAEEDEKK